MRNKNLRENETPLVRTFNLIENTGTVVHTCNPSTQKAEVEEYYLKPSKQTNQPTR